MIPGRPADQRPDGAYVADQVVRLLAGAHRHVAGARVLVLGLAFKENCPDLRNTRVVDIVTELAGFGTQVDVLDPWVDADEAVAEYGIEVLSPDGSERRLRRRGARSRTRRLLADDADLRAWLAPAGSFTTSKRHYPRRRHRPPLTPRPPPRNCRAVSAKQG